MVSSLFPRDLRVAVAAEAVRLVETVGVRRDLEMPVTGFTPRRMRNVTRGQILEHGSAIQRVYESAWVLEVLARVAGESVYRCPYEPEQFVITRLEGAGDTHGWHWDDYGWALVWIAECPPAVDGGFVECVPDTVWDKENSGVEQILQARSVHTMTLDEGDVYLMRTDTTLHRVHPIRRGRRTIVNMAFAREDQLGTPLSHETMDVLWSEPGSKEWS